MFGFASCSFSFEPRMESTSPVSLPSDSSSAPPLSSPPPCMPVFCPAASFKSAPSHIPPASSVSPPASPSQQPLASSSSPPASTPLSSALSEPDHDVPYFR